MAHVKKVRIPMARRDLARSEASRWRVRACAVDPKLHFLRGPQKNKKPEEQEEKEGEEKTKKKKEAEEEKKEEMRRTERRRKRRRRTQTGHQKRKPQRALTETNFKYVRRSQPPPPHLTPDFFMSKNFNLIYLS